jgi:hypothetical protein
MSIVSTIYLDIIHPPVFYLKHDISETGFCLGRQVNLLSGKKYLELASVSGTALSIGTNWVGTDWRRAQNPVPEPLWFK